MNHLEQLVAEWLQYKDYLVRVSIPVGARDRGGYEGELDVVGFHLGRQHLIHIECSLDAESGKKREEKFALKFKRGRQFIQDVFRGATLPENLEQVVVLQFASGRTPNFGGARLVTVTDLVHEIYDGLEGTHPGSKAVSSNLPLLRTLQLAASVRNVSPSVRRLLTI
jgi:hypothetical protein